MTVYIEKPAVNLREELASLRNQGGYQEQQFYFDGLVTNGTFDTDTNWTKGAGVTISGGVVNAASATTIVTQGVDVTVGNTYFLTLDYTETSSTSIRFLVGGVILAVSASIGGTSSGSIVVSLVPTNTGELGIQASGSPFTGTLDNISLFETDGTNVIHRLPKGWKPKDVFEDGLLQREGAAHDYEVVYDGFDYVIKPAVAPSATTQTCVIGVKA
jgi:hypothetical protein